MHTFLKYLFPLFVLSFGLVAKAEYLTPAQFEADGSEIKALVFLSPECPCSRSHVGYLNALKKQFPELKIYGVISEPATAENKSSVYEYFSPKNFDFPLIEDNEQKLVKQFGALKTPHATLLQKNSDGAFKVIYQGGVTDAKDYDPGAVRFLEENLKLVSQGQPPKFKNGRSLGCYIRRI